MNIGWLSENYIDIAGTKVSLASLLVAIGIVLVGFFLASKISAQVNRASEIH